MGTRPMRRSGHDQGRAALVAAIQRAAIRSSPEVRRRLLTLQVVATVLDRARTRLSDCPVGREADGHWRGIAGAILEQIARPRVVAGERCGDDGPHGWCRAAACEYGARGAFAGDEDLVHLAELLLTDPDVDVPERRLSAPGTLAIGLALTDEHLRLQLGPC